MSSSNEKVIKNETVTTEVVAYQMVDGEWLPQSKQVNTTTVDREFAE